jgi:hypothetical protein
MPRRQERIIVTLPPDPGLARLARRVAQYFLRQNGLGTVAARRGALSVERRCRSVLKLAATRAGSPHPVVFVLASGERVLEVLAPRRASGDAGPLCRFERPRPV